MPKLKAKRGYRFIKELGGAIEHRSVSFAAQWLVDNEWVSGSVLDYGCGHGFDADHFGWVGYDPYYRQQQMDSAFETIICNHVLNMLTRKSRLDAITKIGELLAEVGTAFLIVPRNIPKTGKVGLRKRIQNYVVLDLPSIFCDEKMEIYRMAKSAKVVDRSVEIEQWLLQR